MLMPIIQYGQNVPIIGYPDELILQTLIITQIKLTI